MRDLEKLGLLFQTSINLPYRTKSIRKRTQRRSTHECFNSISFRHTFTIHPFDAWKKKERCQQGR